MINFLNESFVIAICFVIFIYFSYKPIKKAIISSLEAKISEIKSKLAESEKLKEDAKQLLEEVEKEMSAFEENNKIFLANAQLSTDRLIELKSKEMDLLIARKKDSATKSIENESAKASIMMQNEFTNNVMNLVKKYLKNTDNNYTSNEDFINKFIAKK